MADPAKFLICPFYPILPNFYLLPIRDNPRICFSQKQTLVFPDLRLIENFVLYVVITFVWLLDIKIRVNLNETALGQLWEIQNLQFLVGDFQTSLSASL